MTDPAEHLSGAKMTDAGPVAEKLSDILAKWKVPHATGATFYVEGVPHPGNTLLTDLLAVVIAATQQGREASHVGCLCEFCQAQAAEIAVLKARLQQAQADGLDFVNATLSGQLEQMKRDAREHGRQAEREASRTLLLRIRATLWDGQPLIEQKRRILDFIELVLWPKDDALRPTEPPQG